MIVIVEYPNHYHGVADIYVDGRLVHEISHFYTAGEQFITEWKEEYRGHDFGVRRLDEVKWRMPVGNHAITTVKHYAKYPIPYSPEYSVWKEQDESAIAELVRSATRQMDV